MGLSVPRWFLSFSTYYIEYKSSRTFYFPLLAICPVIAEKEIHTKKGKPSAEHPLNPDDDQNHPAQYLRFISQHIAKLFAEGNGEKATD